MKRILWFGRDLRVDDSASLALDGEVLPLFLFNPCSQSKRWDHRGRWLLGRPRPLVNHKVAAQEALAHDKASL